MFGNSILKKSPKDEKIKTFLIKLAFEYGLQTFSKLDHFQPKPKFKFHHTKIPITKPSTHINIYVYH